jgi:hypothetical protein
MPSTTLKNNVGLRTVELVGILRHRVVELKERSQVIHSLQLRVITKLRDRVLDKHRNKDKNHYSNLKVIINW